MRILKIILNRFLAYIQIIFLHSLFFIIAVIMLILFFIVQFLDYTISVFSTLKLNGDEQFNFVSRHALEKKYQKIIDYTFDLFD